MGKFDFGSWHVPVVWFTGSFIQHIASEHHCVGLKILLIHGESAEFIWETGLQMTEGERASML